MATDTIVINTSPLILLEKAGALAVAGQLPLRFVCPPAVRRELDSGAAKGYPSVEVPWLTVEPLKTPLSPISIATLDVGEAEVIQLADEKAYGHVCLDDLRGRRIAAAAGLRVTGALGLLARAKGLGIIPALRPICDRLLAEGAWYSRELIDQVLKGVGE